jgi:hypothetical protein
MLIVCPQCGKSAEKAAGAVNRSQAQGAPVYCGRACAGEARRKHLTNEQKVTLKAAYDRRRRDELGEKIRAEKKAAYLRDLAADPTGFRAKQKAFRKQRKAQHAEYCRRPEYRKWKAQYDQKYRSRKEFGPFGEAAIILNDLIFEINSRVSRTEIYRANGTLNKHQTRRREYERQTQRR